MATHSNMTLPAFNWTAWDHPILKREGKPIREVVGDYAKAWAPHIKPGMVCLDVGAHMGDTTVAMAILASQQGFVMAVEPNPAVFPTLVANCKQPNHATIVPLHTGLSVGFGHVTHHYCDPEFLNGGALLPGREHIVKHTHPQEVTMMPAHWLNSIPWNFIKIDTEGNDGIVIQGLYPIITSMRPTVCFEIYPDSTLAERRYQIGLLAHLEYKFLSMAQAPLSMDDMLNAYLLDVIAVP